MIANLYQPTRYICMYNMIYIPDNICIHFVEKKNCILYNDYNDRREYIFLKQYIIFCNKTGTRYYVIGTATQLQEVADLCGILVSLIILGE